MTDSACPARTVTALSGACQRLAATLPAAWHLTAQPDTDGTRGTT